MADEFNDIYTDSTDFSAEDDFIANTSSDTSLEIPDSFQEDTLSDFSEDISTDIEAFPEDTEYEDGLDEITDPDPYDIPDSFEEDIVSDQDDTFSEDVSTDIEAFSENTEYEDGLHEVTVPDSYDAPESGSEATTYDVLSGKIDDIAESDLSTAHKLDLLNQIKTDLEQETSPPEVEAGGEEGSVKVLKRNELDLLTSGNKNIDDILSVKADDYRDKGYTEDEIPLLLANDRVMLQEEFLSDAFPGQDVSIHAFDNINSSSSAFSYSYEPSASEINYSDADIPSYEGTPPVVSDLTNLSDLQNWLGDINPNFDEFDIESPYCNNCGSCAYAVYQRLEGSTDACASADNIGYNSEMNALTGMEQVSMSPEEIKQRLLAAGDGAHAIIGIDRAEGCGHWFNAACIDGRVVAIDGQTGDIKDWPPDYGNVVNWEMSIGKEKIYGHKTR